MTAQRVVAPEWLDTLAPSDPRAVRSRADLRRINPLMGASSMLARSLDALLAHTPDAQLIEFGAGDASLSLRVAQRLSGRWPAVTLRLLDLQPCVSEATLKGFRASGWHVQVIEADVLDWLAQPEVESTRRPIIFANLFLHHFEGVRLQALLAGIAARAQAFACLEPRRSAAALLGSHLLGAIGCNDVTRHDAVVSVRAGFADQELSSCWPQSNDWSLRETSAGLFSHRLEAERQLR